MSRLLSVGERFKAKYKKINGTPFFGQVLSIPDTSRVSNFLSTRRYLRTTPFTNVLVSDVVVIEGLNFIVAEHGTGFFVTPIYKHFKMFEVNETVQWFGMTVSVDQVSGVEKVSRSTDLGLVYLSVQPMSDIEDAIRIQQPMRRCVCNKPVKVDDRLGEWIVTKSDPVLGITLLELKRI